jgi:hypothetical protein
VVILDRFRRSFRLLCSLGRTWIGARILRIASIKGSRETGVVFFILDGKDRVIGAGFCAVETKVAVDFKAEVVVTVIETTGTNTVRTSKCLRKNRRRNPTPIRRQSPLKSKPL